MVRSLRKKRTKLEEMLRSAQYFVSGSGMLPLLTELLPERSNDTIVSAQNLPRKIIRQSFCSFSTLTNDMPSSCQAKAGLLQRYIRAQKLQNSGFTKSKWVIDFTCLCLFLEVMFTFYFSIDSYRHIPLSKLVETSIAEVQSRDKSQFSGAESNTENFYEEFEVSSFFWHFTSF